MRLARRAITVLTLPTLVGGLLVFDVVGAGVPAVSVEASVRTLPLASLSMTPTAGLPSMAPSAEPSVEPSVEPSEQAAEGLEVAAAAGTVLVSEQVATEEFSVLGVTWEDSEDQGDVLVEVRVREGDGWTAWSPLEPNDAAPDEGTEEAELAYDIASTEPLVSEGADGVQVRVRSAAGLPDGAEVVLIDPGTSPSDGVVENGLPLTEAGATVYKPKVVTRQQWGADESLRRCSPSYSSTVLAGTVHHTAGSNGYSASQAPGIVRGIYAYHTRSLGWCDIGYNALVDRFGTIYEGRYGGMDRAVRGAHAGGFNDKTFGVAAVGNYDVTSAPSAMVAGIGKIIGWKLGMFGRSATASVTLTSAGGGTSKYPQGRSVTLPAVFMHRDVGSTACPGRYIASSMSSLRSTAAKWDAAPGTGAIAVSLAHPSGGSGVLLTYHGASGRTTTGRLQSDGSVAPMRTGSWSPGWDTIVEIETDGTRGSEVLVYNSVAGRRAILDLRPDGALVQLSSGGWSTGWDVIEPVDVTGDGRDELLVYNSVTARRWVIRVSSAGGLAAMAGGGWSVGWDVVRAVETDGTRGAELVVYNSTTGRRWLLDLSATGSPRAISGGGWSIGWDTVVPIEVDRKNGAELLFHNSTNGRQIVVKVGSTGGLQQMSSANWSTGWGQVLPVEFNGAAGDELFYVDSQLQRRMSAVVSTSGTVSTKLAP